MKMKLIEIEKSNDFGSALWIRLLKTNKFSFIQLSIDWSDYPGFPYLQFSSGMGKVFDLLICVYKFGFNLVILGHTWEKIDCDSDLTHNE